MHAFVTNIAYTHVQRSPFCQQHVDFRFVHTTCQELSHELILCLIIDVLCNFIIRISDKSGFMIEVFTNCLRMIFAIVNESFSDRRYIENINSWSRRSCMTVISYFVLRTKTINCSVIFIQFRVVS